MRPRHTHWTPPTVHRSLATLFCVALLAGCAIAPRQDFAGDPAAECREVFRRVDRAVAEAGVQDGMTARIEGFPYLRADRFLASYAAQVLDGPQFAEWMRRLTALGSRAHAIEIANLSAEQGERLGHALWEISRERMWIAPALSDCSATLAAVDAADLARRAALQAAVIVPDDYSTWRRAAGLYWITRIPFASGIRQWHEEVREAYARPLAELPVTGELKRYAPPPGRLAAGEAAGLLRRASGNALGIPDPLGADLEALFRTHAPAFAVDTADDADVPGELGWGEGAAPRIVSRLPVVYRRISHTRYQGRALLQLNYWMWFPARPKRAGWDILGGHLDGLLWRVTLAPDGTPWVYDAIHPCGCYHLFFPTARAAPKALPDTLDEIAFIPQSLPRAGPGTRIELRLESGTHYLQRVLLRDAPTRGDTEYVFTEDDSLRSLPLPGGGRRSAFRPDGIVPGTERGERWLFWPMGVPEPGAMRQWGRHATAFVGRRHFDDPGLLERYFVLNDENIETADERR
jgi:hypothetical protein